MPAGVWVDEGLQDGFQALLGASPLRYPDTFAPFVNNLTPDQNTVLSDLTIASDYAFSPIQSSWTFSTDTTQHLANAQQLFTFDFSPGLAGTVIYGFALYDSTSGRLRFVQLFDSPYTVPDGGGPLDVQVNLTDMTCAASRPRRKPRLTIDQLAAMRRRRRALPFRAPTT